MTAGQSTEAVPSRRRRGRPAGDTAERILEAAKEIIAQHGVDALRLAMIGGRLGISAPAIYAHFPGGRSELIDRVAREGVNGVMAFFPRSGGSDLDDLLSGISGLVRFFADNPAFLRIMLLDFSSPEGHPSVTQEIGRPGPFAEGAFGAMYGRLDGILQGLAAADQARPVPASVLLNVMLGATALNFIYPPTSPALAPGASVAEAVDAIVRDLVGRYLAISPEPLAR